MKGKRIIAVCDVLGFTNLLEHNSLDEVVEHSIGWLRKAVHYSLHKGDFPQDPPTLTELQDHSRLGIVWFSDTLLIYTLEDNDDCFRSLTSSIAWLLFGTMRTSDCRIRCGISYGEAYIDAANSIFVGTPIIDAYRLEQSQAWSGGALTTAAVLRLPEEVRAGVFADWFLVPYKVPLHEAEPIHTLAVNWTLGCHPRFELKWSKEHTEPPPEKWQTDRKLCEKWQNTKIFHDKVCRLCRLHHT